MSLCILEWTGKQSDDGRYVHRCFVCCKEYRSKNEEPTLKANCSRTPPANAREARVPGIPHAAFIAGSTPRYLGVSIPAPDECTYVSTQSRRHPDTWQTHKDFRITTTISPSGLVTVTSPTGTFTGQAVIPWDGRNDDLTVDMGKGCLRSRPRLLGASCMKSAEQKYRLEQARFRRSLRTMTPQEQLLATRLAQQRLYAATFEDHGHLQAVDLFAREWKRTFRSDFPAEMLEKFAAGRLEIYGKAGCARVARWLTGSKTIHGPDSRRRKGAR